MVFRPSPFIGVIAGLDPASGSDAVLRTAMPGGGKLYRNAYLRSSMKHEQLALFQSAPRTPEGFRYAPDAISADEEARLVAAFADLPFRQFEFRGGFLGKRRIVAFGSRYDYTGGGVKAADPLPPFLHALRDRAAAFAGLPVESLQQALVTEYTPGAAIGWHRDRPHYGDVIGVSLSAPCTFRLRRQHGTGWERAALQLDRRSVYLMRGPSRDEWEHSIPALEELRYSVTFRALRNQA